MGRKKKETLKSNASNIENVLLGNEWYEFEGDGEADLDIETLSFKRESRKTNLLFVMRDENDTFAFLSFELFLFIIFNSFIYYSVFLFCKNFLKGCFNSNLFVIFFRSFINFC